MRDNRISPLLILLMVLLTAALGVSYFFLPGAPDRTGALFSTPWLSALAAVLSLAAASVSMGLLNYRSFLFSADTRLLYLPFLIWILSIPGSMEFGLYHIALLLMLWSMFLALAYVSSERLRSEYAFGAVVLAGSASIMVPPLIYTEIFIVFYCLYVRKQEPVRYLLACLAGAALPWLYVLVAGYIFPGLQGIEECAQVFSERMALTVPAPEVMQTYEMVWAGFAFLLILRSLAFSVAHRREKSKAQKNSFGFSGALAVLAILTAAFCSRLEAPLFTMTAAVPVSFLAFDLFTNGRKGEVSLWLILLMLLAVAQRVLDFFPDIQF